MVYMYMDIDFPYFCIVVFGTVAIAQWCNTNIVVFESADQTSIEVYFS